jgi:hypothetical protein
MFIFLYLTLHSFGPENFVPLFQVENFQKGLTEENGSYKVLHGVISQKMNSSAIKLFVIHRQHAVLVGKKSSKKKPHEIMCQPIDLKSLIERLFLCIVV